MATEHQTRDKSTTHPSTETEPTVRHYGDFKVLQLIKHAWRGLRNDARPAVRVNHERLQRDRKRIVSLLRRDLDNQEMLVVGPGQVLSEARYFAIDNRVTGLDIDVIPHGWNPLPYWQMFKRNGFGRLAKTVVRKMLGLDRKLERAWSRELGIPGRPVPVLTLGDITDGPPAVAAYDVIGSWAVLQHLPDPKKAIENIVRALKPGGVMYIGIHLYTSFSGQCDYRALSGTHEDLPLWGHLRPSLKHLMYESTSLNRWRLAQWRELFDEMLPGHQEFRDGYDGDPPIPSSPLREELEDYSDEELSTVDLFFAWRKPITEPSDDPADAEKGKDAARKLHEYVRTMTDQETSRTGQTSRA